ncbi:hypothetical protein [uncultured Streptomyces sp.]|uniref:hypothetical protein n=1 Tax=uncultured Streptomyces sp. TaxID=174707 RepID=UPI002610AE44|nr:hypothetical protein [uncultured Streptomyces sp.]
MAVFWWVVGPVVAAVGCWALLRACRFPGGWGYAFGPARRAVRQPLRDARGEVRTLLRAARRERWRARAGVLRAEWSYRRRIRRTEARLRRLAVPQRGSKIAQLGGVVLHRGSVLMSGDELPLAGAEVRFVRGGAKNMSYVYVTHPDGRERVQPYEGEEFPEDAVRGFSVRIRKAAAAAERRQKRRAGGIRALEAQVREARGATGPVVSARQRLKRITADHGEDPRVPRARTALDEARDDWRKLTGRRPLR